MNKKIGAIAIFLILILPLALAQSPPDLEDYVNKIQDTIDETKNVIENNETRTDYLKKEWSKILEDTPIGPFIKAVDNVLNFFSPLFKIILGVEYSLSWAFIFSIIIWLILFGLILSPSTALANNFLTGLIVSFIITSIIGVTGIIKSAINLLAFMITNLWIALLVLIISLLISFLVGKLLKQTIENEKKKSEQEKLQQAQSAIKMHGEVSKKELEGY